MIPVSADFIHELVFQASRSSGPGGQNVNKVNSRVTLKWDIVHSARLTEEQRNLLLQKLSSRISKSGILMISEEGSRSQAQNKETLLSRLDQFLLKSLTPAKVRKPTRPSAASRTKRKKEKRHHSEKKRLRNKSFPRNGE